MRPIRRTGVFLAVGLLAVFLIVSAGVAFRNTRQLHINSGWVTHTQAVLDALERLMSTIKDAETGQRGFLLTGVSSYLDPYRQALADYPTQVKRIAELTAD